MIKIVLIRHKNGSSKNIAPNQDVINELLEASKDNKEIEKVLITRVITTTTEKQRAKLKDLCTENNIYA